MGWIGSLVVALLVSGGGSERVALVGVGVVDVESGEVLPGQTVLIVGREIRAVASEGEVELPPGVTIVNAEGKFLIPGLWDTHVHVTPFGEGVLPLFVAYGVTAVRDVGSTDVIFRWREEIAEAGLTPLEALRTATLTPAQYMHAADSLGSIRPGKLADLVLLDADPLADIRNTERIAAVVANGRYLDRPALDFLLAEARRVHQR